ncbi:MAG: hypothetical protein L0216_02160, partial [Planctomycetales bacterium]|nr:hypothetical protein [Planctomycetales bacterium]
ICPACTIEERRLSAAVAALRADPGVAPSAARRARVVAAAREAAAAPAPAMARAGLAGLAGLAAAAGIVGLLLVPHGPHGVRHGGSGPTSPETRATNWGEQRSDGCYVVEEGGRRLAYRPGRGSAGLPEWRPDGPIRLESGSLEVLVLDASAGPLTVASPGGEARLEATVGARYRLEQDSGQPLLPPEGEGIRPAAGRPGLLSANTGVAPVAEVLRQLAPHLGREFRYDPKDLDGVTAWVYATALRPETLLALLRPRLEAAGLRDVAEGDKAVRIVRVGQVGRVGPARDLPAPVQPPDRAAGDLLVSVEGAGRAQVLARTERAPVVLLAGSQFLAAGPRSGRFGLPTAAEREALVSRVKVRGVAGADGADPLAAVSVPGASDDRMVGAGDEVEGFRVQAVGAGGLFLTRDGRLVRLGLAE